MKYRNLINVHKLSHIVIYRVISNTFAVALKLYQLFAWFIVLHILCCIYY